MKRLLFLCEFGTLSGGENSLLTVLPHLAQNYEVAVASPPEGPLRAALAERGLEHHLWSVRDHAGRRLPEATLREALLALIETTQVDLVHANSLSMARFVGRYRNQLQPLVVGHLRDMLNLSSQALTDIAQCDQLLAVSDATRSWFIERGLPESKFKRVHNGVDLELFRPQTHSGQLAEELGLPASAQIVGAVGQLVQRKGWLPLLDAIELTLERVPNCQLAIIGERWSEKDEAIAYEQQLKTRAGSGRLAGHVHFLGYREDMPALLPHMTLLVHAARQEPLGRVLLEAAAAGVPVIATDVGGTREIFPTQTTGGIVVPLDSPAAMAEAVGDLLGDDQRRMEMAAAARENAIENFSAPRAAHAIQSVYEAMFSSQVAGGICDGVEE